MLYLAIIVQLFEKLLASRRETALALEMLHKPNALQGEEMRSCGLVGGKIQMIPHLCETHHSILTEFSH